MGGGRRGDGEGGGERGERGERGWTGGGARKSVMLRRELWDGLEELWESSGKLCTYKNSRSAATAAVMLFGYLRTPACCTQIISKDTLCNITNQGMSKNRN